MSRSPEPEEPDVVRLDSLGDAQPRPAARAIVPALQFSRMSEVAVNGEPHSSVPLLPTGADDVCDDDETAFFEDGGVVLNELVSSRLDTSAAAVQQGWSRNRRSSTLTPRAGNSTTTELRHSVTRESSSPRGSSVQLLGTPRARSPSGGRRGSVVMPDLTGAARGGSGPRMAATVAPLNVAQSTVSRKSLSDEPSLSIAVSRRLSTTTAPTEFEPVMNLSSRETSNSNVNVAVNAAAAAGEAEPPRWSTAGETLEQDIFAKSDSAAYLETLATSLTSAFVSVQTTHDISRIRDNYDTTEMPTRLCLRAMVIDPTVGAALRLYNEEASHVTDLLFEDCTFSATVDFAWLETLEQLRVLRFKGRQVTTLLVQRALARAHCVRSVTLFECGPITNMGFLHSTHMPPPLTQVEIIGTDMTREAFQEIASCPQIRELKLLETAVRADLRRVLDGNTLELLHLVRCANLYYKPALMTTTTKTNNDTSQGLKLHTLLIADCESLAVRDLPWARLEALRELSVMYQRETRVSAFQTILSRGRLTVLRLQQLFVDAHLVNLIRQCHELQELNLSFCRGATDMNNLWTSLPALTRLNLSFTDTETGDLRTLSACTRLREVYARGCPYLREFRVFHELPQLERLDLAQCASLEGRELHGPFHCAETLTRLSLEGCTTLRELSALKSLKALQSLNLSGSGVRGGEALAALEGFVRLRELNLSRCASLTNLPPLDDLHQLTRVDLSGSHVRDDALQAFCSCIALEEINLSGCDSITAIGPLSLCPSLYVIRLAGSAVTDAGLAAFTAGLHPAYILEELDLSGCTAIADVSCLSALRNLVVLNLAGSSVDGALSFPGLAACDALQAISLCECYQVRDATQLAQLKVIRDVNLSLTAVDDRTVIAFGLCHTLETLELSGCHEVTTVAALAGLPYLQRLNVSETRTSSSSLAALRDCPVLWEVNASGCARVSDIGCFRGYRALQRLSVARSSIMDSSADDPWKATMLEEIDMSQCSLLRTVPFTRMLSSLTALRKVDLTGSTIRNTALVSLAACGSISVLVLRDCAALTSVSPLGALRRLKLLDLSNTGVRSDSLSALADCPLLKTLLLAGCAKVELVQALEGCRALTELDLSKSAVTDASFAEPWDGACVVQTLNLSGCLGIDALAGIGSLTRLEVLDLSRSTVTDAAVARIASLPSLRTLTMCECRGVRDATALSALPQLKSLDLSGSAVRSIGAGGTFWRSPSVTSVSLQRCDGLQNASALSLLPRLTTLDLSFSGIRDVTFASPWDGCAALEELNVSGCLNLGNISGICDLPHLTRLVAANSAITDASLVGIGLCGKLESIDLSGCENVTDVRSLCQLPRLQRLELQDSAVCDVSFETTWLCPSLHVLDVSGCDELSNVDGVRGLPRLQQLDVSFTSLVDSSLYGMRQCQTLERLSLAHCVRTMNLTSLGKLSHLRFLDVRASGIDITSLVSLSRCTQLEELDLTECPFLNNVFVPFEFGSLRVVRLPPLHRVVGAFLEACPDLEALTLRACPANFQVASFSRLHYLKHLDLSESELPNNFLAALKNCVSLEELVLAKCSRLDNVTGLAGLRELRFLDLTATPVRDAACDALLACPSLQWLVLSECTHIRDVSALAGLPRLRRLDLSKSSITDKSFAGITAIRALEELDVHGCEAIRHGDAFAAGMPRLRIVDFTDSGLQSLPTEALCRRSPMLRVLRLTEGVDTSACESAAQGPVPTRCAVETLPRDAARDTNTQADSFSIAWSHWVSDVLAKIAAVAH